MSRHFDRMRYHIADDPEAGGRPRPPGAFTGIAPGLESVAPRFTSNEAAARFYLDHKLAEEPETAGFRAALATESPARVPDLTLRSSRQTPASGTTLVRFDQTHAQIPIFGSDVLVELDQSRELVAMDARLAEVSGAPDVPTLDAPAAVAAVAAATGTAIEGAGSMPPALTYYLDDAGTWHLAWHLHGLPAVLPEARPGPGHTGHGMEDPRPASCTPASTTWWTRRTERSCSTSGSRRPWTCPRSCAASTRTACTSTGSGATSWARASRCATGSGTSSPSTWPSATWRRTLS
ncbi:hypothetical protein [Nonomuraea recticatena]|uniref:hypothetical protein n=1 Tax=Nonomuraea recticatena TaxID=46178 RepID=UPI0036173949